MYLVGVSGNDPKNDFELFLQNYAWVLAVVIAIVIVAVAITFILVNKKKKTKKVSPKKEDSDKWIKALGGMDNIVEVDSTGSRLIVIFKNKDSINREELTKLGVTSIVMMSNKITLVTELDNQKIVEYIKNRQQN